jgi:hypothetical protein
MNEHKMIDLLKKIPGQDLKRVQDDNQRMSQSDIGAEEMKDLLTGKLKKPRAIRDREKNYGGG